MIPQPYYIQKREKSCLALWTTVNWCFPKWSMISMEFTTVKLSLVWCAPSVNLFYLALILHLFVIANNIRCFINKLGLLLWEFSWVFFSPFKTVAFDLSKLSFVALGLKRLGTPTLDNENSTLKSCDTMKQSVYGWQYIRSPMGVENSGEEIYSYRSHNATLFEQIEHSGIQ